MKSHQGQVRSNNFPVFRLLIARCTADHISNKLKINLTKGLYEIGGKRREETDLLVTGKRVEIGKYITLKRVGKIHIRQEIRLESRLGEVDFLRKRTSFRFSHMVFWFMSSICHEMCAQELNVTGLSTCRNEL